MGPVGRVMMNLVRQSPRLITLGLIAILFLISEQVIAQENCTHLNPQLCENIQIYELVWSPDDLWFAALARHEDDIAFTVDIYQTATGDQLGSYILPVMDHQPHTFLWSPNSEKLLVIGHLSHQNNTYTHWLNIIDVNTAATEHKLAEPYLIEAAVWRPDSRSVALWNEFEIKIFQLDTGTFTIVGKVEWPPLELIFSPDGTLLVGILEDRTVHVWAVPDLN